jgi:hypothetical protein
MSPESTTDDIYSDTGGWTLVHQLADEWELTLIRAAFVHAQIPVRMQSQSTDSGVDRMTVLVPAEHEEEATDVLLRVVQAVDHRGEPGDTSQDRPEGDAEEPIVRATPADATTTTLAEREGIGEILHRQGFGYELRVGPEPYAVVLEEDWEQFTELSAQRTEFAIHLSKEFKDLYGWLRAESKYAGFVRLVEATYQGPMADDTPSDFLRGAAWMGAAIVAIALLLLLFRWLQAPVPPRTG